MNLKLKSIMKFEKIVIVPMDHGTTMGPIAGLEDMRKAIIKIRDTADAIVVHKGIFKNCKDVIDDLPVFIHLSVSTDLGNPLKKVLVTTVQEAKDMGAFGVSMHVNIGNEYEGEMIANFGKIARECKNKNMPLLAMIFVKEEKNGKIVVKTDEKSVAHAARLAYELGADIVKVSYPGSLKSLKKITNGCAIPVVIDGGAKKDDEAEIFKSVKNIVDAGGSGVSIGRNIFQNDTPNAVINKIKKILYTR